MRSSSRIVLILAVLSLLAVSAMAGQIVIPRAPRMAPPIGAAIETQPDFVAAACSESEPNELPTNASPISIPGSCSGSVAVGESSAISINYGGGLSDGIEDLFVVTLPSSMRLNIDLTWSNTSGDLDLFLLRQNGSTMDIVDASNMSGSMPESITTGTLTAGTYYIGISAFSGSAPYTLSVAQATSSGACTEDTTTVCLNGGRFRVRATYDTGTQQGSGGGVRLTGDTGYFWFFGNANVEMVVKVLDACSFNQRFWVFVGGLTDVGVNLSLTDTQSGVTKNYNNARGTAFVPIQDTNAFATCGSSPQCNVSVSPGSQSFGSGGGSGNLNVTAGSGCSWSATSNASWITVTSGASGSGNGVVNFSVAANGGGSRSGTISVGGQTATITQSGVTPSCSYIVSPLAASYGSSGGAGSVGISVAAGCSWTASSNASWIAITGGASGSGSGTTTYSVAANSGSARTGTLTVAGQTVTISQAGVSSGGNYDGLWSGTTSQGKAITITVVNSAVTTYRLFWSVAAGACTGDTQVTYSTPRALTGSSFNLPASGGGVTMNVSGSFSSTNTGSGTFTFSIAQSGCSGSASGTFNVTK